MTTNQNESSSSKNSTNSLLHNTGVPCLYRHETTGRYYAKKKYNGKIKQEVLRGEDGSPIDDRKLAERALKNWLANLEKESAGKSVNRTFSEHLDIYCKSQGVPTLVEVAEYLQENRMRKLAGEPPRKTIIPSNKQSVIWTLNKLKNSWGLDFDMPVAKIKTSDVGAFLSKPKNLKPATFNELSRQIKNIFDLALHDGIIETNPREGLVKKGKWRKVERKQDETPTKEQFEKIIAQIRGEEFSDHAEDSGDLAEFLGRAALGEAEAGNLIWKDVDLEKGEIQIQRVKTGKFFTVPIYNGLKALLVKMNGERENKSANAKVFKIASCRKALATASKKLGYTHFSPRSLRKFGITELIRAGVNVKLVSKWQGHQDGGKLIYDTYSNIISKGDKAFEEAELAKLNPPPTPEPAK